MPEITLAAAADAPARANPPAAADLFGDLTRPQNLADLKRLAKATHLRLSDLAALSAGNDPFRCGTRAHQRDAAWFATWWKHLGCDTALSIHLRAIHYRLVSQSSLPIKPNGMPYENTLECWGYLGKASKAARYLGLVGANTFSDNRNPPPNIIAEPLNDNAEPYLELDEWSEWKLPALDLTIGKFKLLLPTFSVYGYEYYSARQPYHLEVWIEKSTMNYILLPLCKHYSANLVTGVGFQSISSVIELLCSRVCKHKKPVRIFYISDFDPAGSFMPDAVARQIEFWRDRYSVTEEIKLQHIALTYDQVITWQLPAIPIKESDRRKQGFIDRYGIEATELDALEALHPGRLANMIRAAIAPYHDPKLRARWLDTEEAANQVADDAEQWIVENCAIELHAIENGVNIVLERFGEQVTALNEELQEQLEPYRKRAERLRHAIQNNVGEALDLFKLPVQPDPELVEQDESGWLFDSERSYLDQIAVYKQRRAVARAANLAIDDDKNDAL